MEHAINWFEIPVADMARAVRFYEVLTGAALRRESYGGPGEEMAVFAAGGGQEAITGALVKNADQLPAQQGTLIYLNAGPSIDACLARAGSAGGQVVVPKTQLPDGLGFFAHFIDSEGNRVGLHAMA